MTTGLVSSSEDNNMVVMRIKDIEGLVSSSPRLTDDFLKKIFVKMWTIFFFQVFVEFVTTLLLYLCFVFWWRSM